MTEDLKLWASLRNREGPGQEAKIPGQGFLAMTGDFPLNPMVRFVHTRSPPKIPDRVFRPGIATDSFLREKKAKNQGFRVFEKKVIPRERKRRTRVPKCPSLIFITIGALVELGEVPIDNQEQKSILHSMVSASESAFASLSME
ncbi:unnamed protein product [Linum trigynum]|uniref:Uncharacterized protein n=1 Tax=Linum trigynum TaxID=586398 RepID=A0AAV2E6G0_9ROSI